MEKWPRVRIKQLKMKSLGLQSVPPHALSVLPLLNNITDSLTSWPPPAWSLSLCPVQCSSHPRLRDPHHFQILLRCHLLSEVFPGPLLHSVPSPHTGTYGLFSCLFFSLALSPLVSYIFITVLVYYLAPPLEWTSRRGGILACYAHCCVSSR